MSSAHPHNCLPHALLICLLGTMLVSGRAFPADIHLLESVERNVFILIQGKIVAGDYKNFILAARKAHRRGLSGTLDVVVNSPGGRVAEAIKIGRAVRRLKLPITTYASYERIAPNLPPVNQSKCYSACFFIWAGSVEPWTLPKPIIGIHRPRFDRSYFSQLTSAEAAAQYLGLIQATKAYLQDMGVRRNLIERMYQIPSTEMDVLGYRELQKYGVTDTLPSYEEWLIAKCGAMTDEELLDLSKVLSQENDWHFSQGYAAFLKRKRRRISNCERKAQFKDRQRAATEMFGSN